MATQIKRRRGTTGETAGFTGTSGEITVDTTKPTVVVHDGITAGGFPLMHEIESYTEIQRDALTPTEKDWVYNTTVHRYQYYDGLTWVTVGA